ncbi:hypothetical protein L226DRAFT_561480 [Lentinus tigrinus ALCF2SS1-7]|uniref:Fungal-type protein kinase domain-containing protein n=1 Tax=Lentinus tigrinus ALCF2SS1-6 TaxID=1328759 RepID=A0A5C2S1C4_9APHY|nr:hypothetical protein L227DRAFT_655641 [Lentinus tigrinus ALCF2SS1-6]RPD73117.1 hypothetical protein L226DRAFT_561480 [Lentinus tigrinus ALCF2SS1-7]
MASRFVEISVAEMASKIPGEDPSSQDRLHFYAPDLAIREEIGAEHEAEKYKTIQTVDNELELYPWLLRSIQTVFDRAGCTQYFVVEHPLHKSSDGKTIVDAGIYLSTPEARAATTLAADELALSEERRSESPYLGRHSWDYVAIPIEMKDPITWHPDRSHISISDSEEGDPALGQLPDYMSNVFNFQHRLFSWAIYVSFDHVRVLYFDRAGAFVSLPFVWTDTSSFLHDFIWKVAHMHKDQLGYDPEAVLLDPARDSDNVEVSRLREAIEHCKLPSKVQHYIKDAFPETHPLYRIRVTSSPPDPEDVLPDDRPKASSTPDAYHRNGDSRRSADPDRLSPVVAGMSHSALSASAGMSVHDASTQIEPSSTPTEPAPVQHRYFLVGRPHVAAESLVGRCTRGFIAFQVTSTAEAGTFCFLKDYWRPLVPGKTRPEHLVYERLRERLDPEDASISIATLVCGGDVAGPRAQMTSVQDALPLDARPAPRVHYHLVTAEIGIPLEEFENFTHLTEILSGAIYTHYKVWEDGDILHRDISPSNIMINAATNQGFLIDWDQSRCRSELNKDTAEPARAGTWQTRSALALRCPWKPYWFVDDAESFVHVFHLLVLRFHECIVPMGNLHDYVYEKYERSEQVNGVTIGGMRKLAEFQKRTPPFEVRGNISLQRVLDKLAELCCASYSTINVDDIIKRYGGTSSAHIPTDTTSDMPLSQRRKIFSLPSSRKVSSPEPVSAPEISATTPGLETETSGSLATPGDILRILQDYKGRDNDKAEDQFQARRSESVAPRVRHITFCSSSIDISIQGGGGSESKSLPVHFAPTLYLSTQYQQPPPPSPPSSSLSGSTTTPMPAGPLTIVASTSQSEGHAKTRKRRRSDALGVDDHD